MGEDGDPMQVEFEGPPRPERPWEAVADGEYAIVELFGHTTLVGRIAEVERFGAKMLALEPVFGGKLHDPVYHGGSAIYRLTPCSRKIAWDHQPKSPYQLPAPVRAVIAPAAPPPQIEDFTEEQDDE